MEKLFRQKKLLVFFLLALFVGSLFFVSFIQASYVPIPGGGSSSTSLDQYREALKEPALNLEQFSLFNLDYTTWGFTKLLIGIPSEESPSTPGRPVGQAPNQHGVFGALASLTATMYVSPPISGVDYLADVSKNIAIGRPARAQVEGYRFLEPVRELWQVSRNVAYLAFVIIFVVIGAMIMARARIDPRTVATVQNAIPGIVIALILVTFSYALSGLMIDVSTVSIRLIAGFFTQARFADPNLLKQITDLETGNKSFFQFIAPLFPDEIGAVKNVTEKIIETILETFGVAGVFGDFLSAVGGGLFALIIALAIVFAIFRTFFMLLTAFVSIIMLTVISPFQFLIGAIPGRGGVFVGWARSMLNQVLIFPVTFAMIVLSAVFIDAENFGGITKPIGEFERSIAPFGFKGLNMVNDLIGLGIFLLTPKVADMVRDALAMKAPPEWAGEPGRAIGGAIRRVLPIG
jgi:hypothetical protein